MSHHEEFASAVVNEFRAACEQEAAAGIYTAFFNLGIKVRSRFSGNPSIAANYILRVFNVYVRIPLEREFKCGEGIPEKFHMRCREKRCCREKRAWYRLY